MTEKEFIPLNLINPLEVNVETPEKYRTWLPCVFPKNEPEPNSCNPCHKLKRPRKVKTAPCGSFRNICAAVNVEPEARKRPDYLNYVKVQKTPQEQLHRLEEIRKEKVDLPDVISLDPPRLSIDHPLAVQVPSPIMRGDLLPKPASKSPSQVLPYVQSKTFIELNAPKTGIIVHETESLPAPSKLPPGYDPRELQRIFEGKKFYVQDKHGKLYAVPMTNKKNSFKPAQKLRISRVPSKLPQMRTSADKAEGLPLKKKQKFYEKLKDYRLSLGFPVGMELGTHSIFHESFPNEIRGKQGLACALVALGYAYIKREVSWTTQTIDKILHIGSELYKNSLDEKGELNEDLLKSFQIDDVKVGVKFDKYFCGHLCSTRVDEIDVYQGLSMNLKKNKFLIFRCRHCTLLIWRKKAMFVFDPCGRQSNGQLGKQSALITLKEITNIVHLIVNLSGIGSNATFSLIRVKVVKLEPGKPRQKAAKITPKVQVKDETYEIINYHRAILRCEYHLRHPIYCETRNRQSLSMSIVALASTKIQPPSTWTVDNLKQILVIGNDLFKKWSNSNDYLTLKDLPSSFQLAQYAVGMKINPFQECVPVDEAGKENLVLLALEDFMDEGQKILLQVGRMFFAAWRKNQINYLFDPYPRDKMGDVCLDQYGKCCVHMFSYLQELSHRFRHNMIQINSREKIYFHTIDFDELIENPGRKIEPGLTLMQQGIPRALDVKPSLAKMIDFKIPKAPNTNLDAKDRILILDSPSASLLSLVDCKPLQFDAADEKFEFELPKVANENLSNLDITGDEQKEELKEITPSVDYICGLMANELTDQTLEHLPKKEPRQTLKPSGSCEVRFSEGVEIIAEEKEEKQDIIATNVLFKSDLKQLQYRRQQIQKEPDEHSENDCFPALPLTLSQELMIPSNFKPLPDGSFVIFGTRNIFTLQHNLHVGYLLGVTAISAAAVSFKYSIATWNSDIIDYVFEISQVLAEASSTNLLMYDFFKHPNHNFPLFELGQKKYKLRVELIQVVPFGHLKQNLLKLFEKTQRILVLSPKSSMAVFKRKKLFYMFESCPCNIVGYRNNNGFACFLRFKCIEDLIFRLEANHNELTCDTNVALSQIILSVLDEEMFLEPRESVQEEIMKIAIEHKHKKMHKRQEKLNDIDKLIEEERARIAKFKPSHSKKSSKKSVTYSDLSLKESRKNFQGRPSTSGAHENYVFDDIEEDTKYSSNVKPQCGYFQRKIDLLHKIQGSTSLLDRCFHDSNIVRPCLFSAMYAALTILHHPVTKWNQRRIDQCLEYGKEIYEKLTDKTVKMRREVDNVLVDDLKYNVAISSATINYKNSVRPLKHALEGLFLTQQTVLVQFPNACFAIHKDHKRLYHLFDSYASMELCNGLSQMDQNETENKAVLDEENTASWILFVTIEDILLYLIERTKNLQEYWVYKVQVLSYKKAPKQSILNYLLHKTENKKKKPLCGVNVEDKLEPEKISFVESIKMPPWSRLLSCNLLKQKREDSQWKHYSTEIDRDLYSLWGNIHPAAPIFNEPGKQYLAIYTVACGIASLYHLDFWTPELMDSIVINGNAYYETITQHFPDDYEFEMSDLNGTYNLNGIHLKFTITPAVRGTLYDFDLESFNLSLALTYFFHKYKFGILLMTGRALLIGKESAYFMLDCQSIGKPLFQPRQGAMYMLRCCSLRRLLDVIVLTLNIKRYCIEFALYPVNVKIGREIKVLQGISDEMIEDNDREEEEEEVETKPDKKESHVSFSPQLEEFIEPREVFEEDLASQPEPEDITAETQPDEEISIKTEPEEEE